MRDVSSTRDRERRSEHGLAAVVALGVLAAHASGQGWQDSEPEPARPMLIAETEALVAGELNTLACSFDIDDGWHVYWPGQNTTGFAPTIELSLPEGWEAGEIIWPTPHRHVLPGEILDHIYEDGEATFLIPVRVPEDAALGDVRLSADLEWLVCREACIPGWGTVTLETAVVSADTRPAAGTRAGRISKARANTPVPTRLTASGELREAKSGRATGLTLSRTEATGAATLEFRIESGMFRDGVRRLSFYPHESGASVRDLVRAGERSAKQSESVHALRLVAEFDEKPLRGILVVEPHGSKQRLAYRIEVPSEREPHAVSGG